jgi:hypothetical protein
MTFRLELTPQFTVIIDLTIESQCVAILGVYHWLMAASAKINYAQPVVADSETNCPIDKTSSVVRTAMSHRSHHPIKRGFIRTSSRLDEPPTYCTHETSLLDFIKLTTVSIYATRLDFCIAKQMLPARCNASSSLYLCDLA